MKKSITLLTLFLGTLSINAQEVHLTAGYKAAEIGYSYVAENELIFGLSVSAVDSKLTEKRANNNDHGKTHSFHNKYTPAAFGLIGGEFEEFSIIGKMGAAYLNQSIDGIAEPQKIYFAVGIMFDYKISNVLSIKAGYDNVNSVMVGVGIKI